MKRDRRCIQVAADDCRTSIGNLREIFTHLPFAARGIPPAVEMDHAQRDGTAVEARAGNNSRRSTSHPREPRMEKAVGNWRCADLLEGLAAENGIALQGGRFAVGSLHAE